MGHPSFQEIEDDTNIAGGKSQSNDKGSSETMEVSETAPAPSKPERKTKQPPTPAERTAPKTPENTGKGEEDKLGDTASAEAQAPKSTRAPPKRPPTVRRPPPPSKRPHTDVKSEDTKAAAELPVGGLEKAEKEAQEKRDGGGEEERREKPSQPPKRPSTVKRPPPPTARPVPRQREKSSSPETQKQVEHISLPKEEISLQSPTSKEEEGEKIEGVQAESRPTPMKRLPSVSRPPPPSKRPHPQAAPAAEIDKEEKIEGQVVENEIKHDTEEEPAVTSPKQDKPPSPHSPGPKRPQPPAIKKRKVADEATDVKEEESSQPPPPPPPAQPQPLTKKSSIKRPPPPAMPKKQQPVKPVTQEVEAKPVESDKVEETEPAKNESREGEISSEKEPAEDKSTEAQVNLAVDSKQEPKEQEVVEKKPAVQHSPGPKRPAPPSTKKLSIKKPPPPATSRKPSVKAKQPPPPVIKKDEKTEGETVTKEVTQVEEHIRPRPPEEQPKEAKPVIVESSEKVEREEDVSTTEPSRTASSESTEKMTMTVLVQPGRKSPKTGRRSPNMGRKSPILRKKSRQGGQEESDEEELEGSVKIIKYPSGSSLTKNTNGKAGEAEGEYVTWGVEN